MQRMYKYNTLLNEQSFHLDPPMILEFERIITGNLSNFLKISAVIGDIVLAQVG